MIALGYVITDFNIYLACRIHWFGWFISLDPLSVKTAEPNELKESPKNYFEF